VQLSGVRTFQPDLVRPVRAALAPAAGRAYVTWLLTAGVIVMMLAQLAGGTSGYRAMIDSYGLRSAGWSWFELPEYGRLLSYAFLHGTGMHLFWNTLLLLMIGCVIEWRFGSKALLGIFLFGVIVSALTHLLMFPAETRPLIGASGGVAALMGAASVLIGGLGVQLRIPGTGWWCAITLRRLLLCWLALQFLGMLPLIMAGQDAPGVAYWSHISGFFTGLGSAYGLRFARAPRRGGEPRGDFASTFASAGD
jgi:membrane associated rhomboid family serine protease